MKTASIILLTFIFLAQIVLAKDYELTEHNIKWTGSMPSQTHYGQLTPSTFEIDIDDNGLPVKATGDTTNGWILEGSFKFNRQDFGVSYQNKGFLGTAKDKLIEDYVTMDIRLVTTPKK